MELLSDSSAQQQGNWQSEIFDKDGAISSVMLSVNEFLAPLQITEY